MIKYLKKKVQLKSPNKLILLGLFRWPTRTRTLNDGTKNRCVTNYTIGQCFLADANLTHSFNFTNYFLQFLNLTNFYEDEANQKNP